MVSWVSLNIKFRFNRTIVEWKFRIVKGFWVVNGEFQSHHSGMEIYAEGKDQIEAFKFQSHHSGMEILWNKLLLVEVVLCFNRTIVEWK